MTRTFRVLRSGGLVVAALWLLAVTPCRAVADSLVTPHPLIDAAKSGDVSIAHSALLRGDDPDIVDDDGMTPLLYAIKNEHPGIVKVLLDGHASAGRAGRDGKPPLLIAAALGETPVVAALIKAGAKVDQTDKQGMTPLMAAAQSGQEDVVTLLLASGAQVGRSDYSGRDALGWAEDGRNPRVVSLLKAASH